MTITLSEVHKKRVIYKISAQFQEGANLLQKLTQIDDIPTWYGVHKNKPYTVRVSELGCLTSHATIFQLYIYMWRHIHVDAARAHNAKDIPYGSLTCPSKHRHGTTLSTVIRRKKIPGLYVKTCRRKVRKTVFSAFYVPKGAVLLQQLTHIDDTWTWSEVHKKKVIIIQNLAQYGQTSPYHNTSRMKTGV